tara:strand:- start:44 stop:484 length:441 start_codon:yes stop_codon:yes gene_type:complete
MPKKTPPFKHFSEWTTARFFGFIRSGLREKFNRYPVKYRVLGSAATTVPVLDDKGLQVEYKSGPKKGTLKFAKAYKCASCEQLFNQKSVQVDHIEPAGSLQSFEDLASFAERLFCGEEGLQILCTQCHDIKTKEDRENARNDKDSN